MAEAREIMLAQDDSLDPAEVAARWRSLGQERSLRALGQADSAADRLVLIRSLVTFADGRLSLSAAHIALSAEEEGLLGRFGLARDGDALRLQEIDLDYRHLPELRTALRLDSAQRQLFRPGSPDAALFRLTSHARYKSAAQKSAMRALLTMPAGGSLLVSMPTGSGKSLLFQVAALEARRENPGACVIVVTPTIALALDHQRTLAGIPGLEGSIALTGDVTGRAREDALFSFRRGEVPVLLLSPEQAFSTAVASALFEAAAPPSDKAGQLAASLAAFVIDEAHIVEQWGRNFRPDFQRLSSVLTALRDRKPDIRALLLSATLPAASRQELRRSYRTDPGKWLEIDAHVPRCEFDVVVKSFEEGANRQRALDLLIDRAPRPAVIYTTLVEEASELYDRLRSERGYRRIALFTGAISDPRVRKSIVGEWAENKLDLVVATSAFGMGIDKSDVRAVVHACLPESPARWYQEIGRGGRDGHQALAACLFTDPPYRDTRPGDVTTAYGLATSGWIGRDLAELRWAALLRKKTSDTWHGDRRWLTLDLDAVREGLPNRSSDYNRSWNRALLTLLQRAGVLEVVSTGPIADDPGEDWIVDVTDARLFDGASTNVWDHIFSIRNAEQAEAQAELDKFVGLMRHPEKSCLMRAAFEMIEGAGASSEPCGRCPSCRSRLLSAPAVLSCEGLETAWGHAGVGFRAADVASAGRNAGCAC
ncbi:DEAD/DEAH box helicase [Devosia sp. ZB163]|uniref:DEAD/DEAH box helicase n=1 Tax=Devosia sp. ZB163 TaxID=3025938 RepID=UPI002360620D|nr:DEAD/DEAH box helicase [Devosia sp. ZB163]MDC9824823.1 DEAD/DEAH box helicase [Devosia sp. ZB163]